MGISFLNCKNIVSSTVPIQERKANINYLLQ